MTHREIASTGFSTKLRTVVMTITPEVASQWLAVPLTHKRIINEHRVRKYAYDMAHEDWIDQGAPIQLTADHAVVDGRHRLSAIIRTGIARDMVVVIGVEESAFAVIDSHQPRRPDQFIEGGHRSLVTAGALFLLALESCGGVIGRNFNTAGWPIDTVVEYVEKHPILFDVVSPARRIHLATGLTPSVMLAQLSLVADRPEVDEWIVGLETGAGLADTDPRLVLRNRLMRDKTLGIASATARKYATWGLVVKAWNAHIRGDRMTIIRVSEMERPRLLLGLRNPWNPRPDRLWGGE